MEIDLFQVVGTLRYGAFNERKRKEYFTTSIVIIGLFAIAMIIPIIIMSISYPYDNACLVFFIIGAVGFSISVIVSAVLLSRYEKIRKEILKWSEDAVELYAYSKCVGEQESSEPFIFNVVCAKIEVTFKLDDKKYKRLSGKTGRLGTDDGFLRLWLDYRDREIRIMYSPKYDQVIVLKDKDN